MYFNNRTTFIHIFVKFNTFKMNYFSHIFVKVYD